MGWSCLHNHEEEGVWCTWVQTELLGLSFALGMASSGARAAPGVLRGGGDEAVGRRVGGGRIYV